MNITTNALLLMVNLMKRFNNEKVCNLISFIQQDKDTPSENIQDNYISCRFAHFLPDNIKNCSNGEDATCDSCEFWKLEPMFEWLSK